MSAIIAPRPDKPTLFVVEPERPDQAVEVDGHDPLSQSARLRLQGGAVGGLAVSTTRQGRPYLTVYFEAGSVEVWDLTSYTLLQAFTTSSSRDSKSSSKGPRSTSCLAGSNSLPTALAFIGSSAHTTVQVIRAYPTVAVADQRMESVDPSRRKLGVVAMACHPRRPMLAVCYTDGAIQLYDLSKMGKEEAGAGGSFGGGGSYGGAGDSLGMGGGGDDGGLGGDDSPSSLAPLPAALANALMPPIVNVRAGNLPQPPPMSCLAFHPSVDLLAAGGPTGCVFVWPLNEVRDSQAFTLVPVQPLNSGFVQGTGNGKSGGASIVSVDFVNGSPLVLAIVREYTSSSDLPPSNNEPTASTSSGIKLVACAAAKSNSLSVLYVSRIFQEPAQLVYSSPATSLLLMEVQPRMPKHTVAVPLSRLIGHLLYPVLALPVTLPTSAYVDGLAKRKDFLPVTCTYISTSQRLVRGGLPVRQNLLVSLYINSSYRMGSKHSEGGGSGFPQPASYALPSSVEWLKKLLSSRGGILDQGGHVTSLITGMELETTLVPTRLVTSHDRASIVVFLEIVPSQRLVRQAGDGEAGVRLAPADLYPKSQFSSPCVFLLYVQSAKDAPFAEGCELVACGLGMDGAFLSGGHVAILEDDGKNVALYAMDVSKTPVTVRRASEAPMEAVARRIFPVPNLSSAGRTLGLLYVVQQFPEKAPLEGALTLTSRSFKPSSSSMPIGDTLVMSRADGLGVGLGAAHERPRLALWDHEYVHDASWQQVPGEPPILLLGLITTKRVLILTSQLEVVARTITKARATSLLWVGPSLMYTTEDGRVNYIAADKSATADRQGHVICGLSQRHAEDGVALVAALPDRLVYAFRAGGPRGTRICSRPLFPLEPLVLGTLALPSMTPLPPKYMTITSPPGASPSQQGPPPVKKQLDSENNKAIVALLRSLVEKYSPSSSALEAGGVKYGATEGPGRNAGGTIRACVGLCEAGLFGLAGAAAGVTNDAAAQGAEAYRKRPWISPELKAGIAAACAGWNEALAEELAEDPMTQEYALNPNSFQNASLPSRCTRISGALAAVGDDARLCGQFESALRLYDASGEDQEVLLLLILHATYSNSTEAANLLKETLSTNTIALLQAYAKLLEAAENGQVSGDAFVAEKLSSFFLPFASQRRSSLLPSTAGQELKSFAVDQAKAPVVLGPPASGTRKLVLDRVEEWLGRVRPEVLDEDGGDGETGSGESSDEWVKGVGQGREDEDNVVGYWRFSEMTPTEEGPANKLNGDLSMYGNVLEVVTDEAGSIRFETSTSMVDPGDEAKSRPAYDACFSSAPVPEMRSAKYPRTLALHLRRGAALDVGAYHSQLGRTKLTVELWVQRPEQPSTVGDLETLVTRGLEDNARIWTLAISKEGSLVFHAGEKWSALGGEEDVRTSSGLVEPGKWYHVAMTMECKGKQGAQASVALFVQGREMASGNIRLPTISETRLRNQILLVGPNLQGHRLTELRLWAVSRSPEDLYDHRESYLKLAEKRKRLTFKIRDVSKVVNAAFNLQQPITKGTTYPMTGPNNSVAARRRRNVDGQANPPADGAGESGLPPLLTAPSPGLSSALRSRRSSSSSARSLTPEVDGEGEAVSFNADTSGRDGFSSSVMDFASEGWGGPAFTTASAPPGGLLQPPRPTSNRRVLLRGASGGASPEPSLSQPPPATRSRRLVSKQSSADSVGSDASLSASTTSMDAAFKDPALFDSSFPPVPPTAEEEQGKKAPLTLVATLALEELLKFSDLGIDSTILLRDIRAPVFSLGAHFLCLRERSPQPGGKTAITVVTVAGRKRARYPFQAESAVINGDVSAPLVGCYALSGTGGEGPGALQIYDIENRKGVSQQPIATQMLYWRWMTKTQVGLVTPRAVFHWTIKEGGPQKIFEKREGWGQMSVADYHLSGQDKWAVLTLRGRGTCHVHLHSLDAHQTFVEADVMAADVGRLGHAEGPLVLFVLKAAATEKASLMLEVYQLPSDASSLQGSPSLSSSCTLLAKAVLTAGDLPLPRYDRVSLLFPDHPDKEAVTLVLFHEPGLLFTSTYKDGQLTATPGLLFGSVAGRRVRDAAVSPSGDLMVLEDERATLWRVPIT